MCVSEGIRIFLRGAGDHLWLAKLRLIVLKQGDEWINSKRCLDNNSIYTEEDIVLSVFLNTWPTRPCKFALCCLESERGFNDLELQVFVPSTCVHLHPVMSQMWFFL